MENNIFARKDFLNKDFFESDASIFSNVQFVEGVEEEKDWIYAELKIRDCNKAIALNLNSSSKEKYENSLYKLDTLIEHLTELRSAIVGARAGKQTKKHERTKTNI